MRKITILLFASLFFYLVSCKNEAQSITESDELASIKLDSVKFFNSSFKPYSSVNSIKHNFTKGEDNNSIYAGTFALNNIDFVAFLNKINIGLGFSGKEEKVVSFILYINDFQNNISEKNIDGISYFINTNEGLLHKFLIRNGNNFKEESKLGGFINSFTTSDFDVLLNYSLRSNGRIIKPAYITFNTPFEKVTLLSEKNETLSSILIDNNLDITMFAEGGCGSSCAKGDGGCDGELCDACASSQTEQVAEKNKIKFDVNETFSKPIAYDFRDNFLKKNSVGKKYVNYYYKLSYFTKAKNIINKSNFWDHISLGVKLYEVANKLQFGKDDEVAVTESFKNDVLKMLELYNTKTSNNSLKLMFIDIKKDIESFNGKNRKEILELIK